MFLRIAMSLASQGPKALEDMYFKFESKISGATYQPPRYDESYFTTVRLINMIYI